MFGLVSLDPIPVPVEAIRLIAIGVWEVGGDTERFVEHLLGLPASCLLDRGAMSSQILIQCGTHDFGQRTAVAGAQLLDLATLIFG